MSLDKQTVQAITETVLKEVRKQQDRHSKQHKDRRLRNTKLLVENYRMLNKHCEGINADLKDYEEYTYDPDQIQLHTLMKYKVKTKKMLNYFDSMLRTYKEYCELTGPMAARRYKILYTLYIDDDKKSADDVAEFYNMDRSTVFRDAKKATEELSIFLFGLDSLNDLHATNLP